MLGSNNHEQHHSSPKPIRTAFSSPPGGDQRQHSKKGRTMLSTTLMLTFVAMMYCFGETASSSSPSTVFVRLERAVEEPIWEELSQGLIVEEFPDNDCPKHCGCFETKKDCERLYDVASINKSASQSLTTKQQAELVAFHQNKHQQAKQSCGGAGGGDTTASGGWCLANKKDEIHQRNTKLTLPNGDQIVTHDYWPAAPRIVQETVSLLQDEHATSLTEFGSGVGQLLVDVLPKLPADFSYHAFDGAGNVEEKSHGYVKWADMSLPLDVPRSDWVISYEVAEHVPAKYEAMLIRNLHKHNCQGIILSWAVLGRGGRQHINNHSNQYVKEVFAELGYTMDVERQERFRKGEGNKSWFQQSVMVFRRKEAVC